MLERQIFFDPKDWVAYAGRIQTCDHVVSNQCCDCGFAWADGPGVFASQDQCPACGSLYWKAHVRN